MNGTTSSTQTRLRDHTVNGTVTRSAVGDLPSTKKIIGARVCECCEVGWLVLAGAMASDLSFVEYVCDQLHDVGRVTYRKMFGEIRNPK
jgi:hypothetical protein